MLIIKDTQEKDGWDFSTYENVEISNDSLPAGDYTLAICEMPNFDESVIIERKQNCRELLGNLGQNFERFTRELEQLQKFKHKQIVVCGPNNFEYLVSRGYTKLNLNFIYRQLAFIYTHYGVSTIFFPNKDEAENYVYRLFTRIIKKLESEN